MKYLIVVPFLLLVSCLNELQSEKFVGTFHKIVISKMPDDFCLNSPDVECIFFRLEITPKSSKSSTVADLTNDLIYGNFDGENSTFKLKYFTEHMQSRVFFKSSFDGKIKNPSYFKMQKSFGYSNSRVFIIGEFANDDKFSEIILQDIVPGTGVLTITI